MLLLLAGYACAQSTDANSESDDQSVSPSQNNGRIATLDPADVRDFTAQPRAVQRLLSEALRLTKLNLAYRYGSDDPASGGMDCSGTIHYLLGYAGVGDPPRDSSEIYRWMWTQGRFESVVSSSMETFELSRLKPGDLLFWTGTYHVTRDPPVTHVMIYLGIDRHTGERVMMGASEGRRFEGISRSGVSVFDFVLPRAVDDESGSGDHARFIGYGSIPGLKDISPPATGN
jgi:cell wall-associated NlpC family hydrolase